MNTEEHDDLWCLLGKAKAPVVSPFFSRNILRTIGEEAQEKRGAFGWLWFRWQLAAVSACLLILAGFALTLGTDQPDKTTMIIAKQVSQSPDYQVIIHLDELLASEESSVWLEQ